MESPLNSFLRYVLGFLLFISISFGVTFGVNAIATRQTAAAQQAAALKALLDLTKQPQSQHRPR